MALKGRVNHTIANENLGSDGDLREINMLRDGTVVTADWIEQAIIQGRGYMATVGALSTPITGGGAGSTIVDLDTPEVVLGVASGTTVRPFSIRISCLPSVGAADDDEYDVLIAVDQDKRNASTSGTSTAATIYNLNTLNTDQTSTSYVNTAYSATMTDPVLDLELAHATKIFELHSSTGIIWLDMELIYEPRVVPIINGPAMICVYWGGTKANNAFCTLQWLEYPSSRYT
jgi:hypothetical protein